uniref:Uncharacterized protein n=1 Tax=Hyaloperonospora arabidopsidis (strain Emoy2) TaxID=559515 RepID=M4BYW4_HYAAE
MTEELNDGYAVAAINVITKVLEDFGSPTVRNLYHKCYSWTQVELLHLKRIVAQPQLRSTVSRKVVRK